MKSVKRERVHLENNASIEKMPGHWLLAKLGKRVLRPGGLQLTRQMLVALDLKSTDAVVEFAPGLGVTAQLALSCNLSFYTAIERDETAAESVRRYLAGANQKCIVAQAEDSKLPATSATVVYGEAMLTMQSPDLKTQIITEAFRLLKPGGHYGIHELCLVPDGLDDAKKNEIEKELSAAIQVDARPLTPSEWRALMEGAGFRVQPEVIAPMHLLELKRFLQDEGWRRFFVFAWNLLRNYAARQRAMKMQRVFRKYQNHLAAIMLIGVKSDEIS